MPPSLQRTTRRDRGFALLITITLLAFLVLLLVSLASLTRVETQVAANSQQLAQARQNALTAMNIALGRLQQLAGPDQRITGTADLVAGVNVSKQKWTGVWKWDTAAPSTPAWLVSTATTSAATGNAGATSALPATGTVTLVGAGSTDITVAGNEVKVETQSISSDAVPGFSGPQTVGNFAYWVGDEGVKAKVSLSDPWESPTAATKNATGVNDATAALFRFAGTSRTGVEGVGKNADDDRVGGAYPFDPTTNPAAYQAFKANLPKVLSPGQLAMANPPGAAALAGAAKSRFHDLTASSVSVMTNVVDGGLKKDLTAWLSKPDGPANPPRDTDYIANASTYMPRWSQIRSYAAIVADGTAKDPVRQDAEALPTTPVTAASTAPKQGIYPVITYARMGFNVSCEGPNKPIAFHLFPVVTLWNPTNVPIAAHDYEMRFDDQDYFNVIVVGKESEASALPANHTLQRRASYNKVGTGVSSAFATGFFGYSTVNAKDVPVNTANKTPLRFRLKMPQIEPGQSLVFTLRDPSNGLADEYSARNNVMEAHSPTQADNSVVMFGPTMTAPDLAERYFMSNTGGQTQLSLRDYNDPTIIYHWLQGATTFAAFLGSTPTNSSFLVPHPGVVTGPLIYSRMELYQSQGQHGTINPPPPASKWFGANPRWLALFNPIAPHSLRLTGGVTNSFTHHQDFQGITNPGPSFGNGNRAAVGPGEDVSTPVSDLIVHEFLKPGVPLFSLAQLQHVNVSQMTHYPAYAIGNSLASVYVKRTATVYPDPLDPTETMNSPQQPPFRNLTQIYDLSYVLNRTLWDKYFFSTVPASLTLPTQITADYKLPNSRHSFHWPDNRTTPTAAELAELKTTDSAAAHLLINGGFNVNSTSVQAWRALLYSRNGLPANPANSDPATYKHPYARYPDSTAGVSNTDVWRGNRILSDGQIDALAVKIVDQVKLRGPFLSLASFVNRRLVPAPDATGLKGTLQAAIDAVDRDSTIAAINRINFRAPFTTDTYRVSVLSGPVKAIPDPTTKVIRAHWLGDDDDANNDKPDTSRAAFAPGFLTQADLLTSLGPVLTARSDTFTIRAYGDVQNPATSSIDARAWCEAVVQRLPDYMETLDAWSPPVAGTNNEKFGRRFRIISFRWLATNDI